MKIVITGGHHNSALSVVDELNKKGKHEYLWFGHRHSVWGDKSDSAEFKEVNGRGIDFVDLKAGKLYKTFNPLKLLRVPHGFFNAFYHLIKFRPKLVLSFGGYLAAPTAMAAWLLDIPVFTHEQTVVAGWSNRFIARLAKKVFVTWPESAQYFPKNKVVITGLPLRKELIGIRRQTPYVRRGLPIIRYPTVYITGGKQGSHVINKAILKALPKLLKDFQVIHQCGAVSFYNDKKVLKESLSRFPKKIKEKYVVEEYFLSEVLADIFKKCDFVVTRGGAHTVYEVAYLAKPAIIIPIPWVSHQEQLRNAKILEEAGLGVVLEEQSLTPESLLAACKTMQEEFQERKKRALAFSKTIKADAASVIADEISLNFE